MMTDEQQPQAEIEPQAETQRTDPTIEQGAGDLRGPAEASSAAEHEQAEPAAEAADEA